MTTLQRVAQVFGIAFVAVAVLGFFTSGGSMVADVDRAPRVLGLFPVNLLHNLVHLAFGIWGLAASRSWSAAKQYCQISGVAYLGLMALAFLTPTMFGLVPIGSHDIWLHALLGAGLTYFGFTARDVPGRRAAV